MNTQLALKKQPAKEYYLKALNGALKNTVYRLTSKEIFLGRDQSNHIKIQGDSKVSRRHARLVFHKENYYIQNISENNFISINGEKTKQAPLFNNCIIAIGDHSFKFVSVEATAAQESSLAAVSSQGTSATQFQNFSYNSSSANAVDQSSNKRVIYIVFGVLFALVIGSSLLKPKPKVVKSQEDIETTEKILERIKKSQASIDAYKKSLEESGANSKDYKKSKELFVKGFRDFQKSQFSSAIGAFEVALVHNPENIEAKRYLELSKRRAEELIEFYMVQGRAHKENNKFDFCISSFKNVMTQINDKTDNRYTEARKLLKECMLLERSKY